MSTREAVWEVANRLGVVAGTPAELFSALLAGPRRTVRVPLPPDHALVRALRPLGQVDLVADGPPELPPAAPVDLGDPAAVCAADPVRVTRGYEADPDPRGGLRPAWLRAGQSLLRDQDPAERALVLLAALDGAADPRLAPALARRAAGSAWRLASASREPCTALTTAPDGRLVVRADRVAAAACLPDGTQVALDERGRLRVRGGPGGRLTDAVAATLHGHPATALAAAGGALLTGDRMGTVHAFALAGLEQAGLHSGRVTALTATATATATTVYSGGEDGTVRVWRPGRAPRRTPVTHRPYPVVALHAHARGRLLAVAWADGLAELHHLPGRRAVPFRPGPRVRAVAVTDDGSLAVGLDDAVLRLTEAEADAVAGAGPGHGAPPGAGASPR
ncbi:WD40 repeat domain-containing protein [Streptomyces lavendofoliae]|uniref:WD40 repeat domain-containing protein n=1 Tax=Streptomyces lavendofoliae TaxID=67314 RepID=UPI003D9367B6